MTLTDRSALIPAYYLPPPRAVFIEGGTKHYPGVIYAQPIGYRTLQLDLWVPEAAEPPPLVVWIHGGAWLFGDRRVLPDTLRPNQIFDDLVNAGLAVATVDYRHASEQSFPAQLHDVKAAVRYLRGYADELGIDTRRIGVWGESAGGHLAALVALTGGREDLEGAVGLVGTSSAVDAAVVWYAPADLASMPKGSYPPEVAARLRPELRGPRPEEVLVQDLDDITAAAASPVTHIHSGAPPFLLIYGDADLAVPFEQGELFAKRLRAAEVPVSFVAVAGAGHTFEGSAEVDEIVQRSVQYLAAQLSGEHTRASR